MATYDRRLGWGTDINWNAMAISDRRLARAADADRTASSASIYALAAPRYRGERSPDAG